MMGGDGLGNLSAGNSLVHSSSQGNVQINNGLDLSRTSLSTVASSIGPGGSFSIRATPAPTPHHKLYQVHP
eukprot:Pgem_evm1s17282